MNAWLFTLFLILLSDMVAAFVLAIYMWSLRNGGHNWLVKMLAALFWCIFLRGGLEFLANCFGYQHEPIYTLGFGACYWLGRGFQTAGMWALLIYMFSRRRRGTGLRDRTWSETDRRRQVVLYDRRRSAHGLSHCAGPRTVPSPLLPPR